MIHFILYYTPCHEKQKPESPGKTTLLNYNKIKVFKNYDIKALNQINQVLFKFYFDSFSLQMCQRITLSTLGKTDQ